MFPRPHHAGQAQTEHQKEEFQLFRPGAEATGIKTTGAPSG
jgi:hypothetical protein